MDAINEDWKTVCTVLKGETAAYALIIDRYQSHVSTIVGAHVPQQCVPEVAHDTFVRAYGSLALYVPKKPFKHWLTTIALRACTDFWRSHYRKKESPVCDFSDDSAKWFEAVCLAESKSEFERLSQAHEARDVLHRVLDSLAPLDRMILIMTQLEEYSSKETAELLGISSANVKVRTFRVKCTLKKLLKKFGIEGA
ncbi:RNA polymerase sigma factor [Halodesulfovibrio marinisediminis]|uniref:RNA polymerase sigma-70 factor, ECF subfamily n=1 Tax=Halodesulfovibrio marinisediminis DSM 17456 TaxID=1121457 RepID=A0A1N6IU71_9BACT|nr:RNA polymerase sigma factor [Halodesulfovibrio marinisediminis]SIO35560.1 RNA polymerase sigma-70 factor, ECF subfamily [Halodesulfovibrio marinisediminis DSM 17456]